MLNSNSYHLLSMLNTCSACSASFLSALLSVSNRSGESHLLLFLNEYEKKRKINGR